MKRIFLLCCLISLFYSSANATLWDRGNGLIYDDVQDITWLQDANYSVSSGYDDDGEMYWDAAVAWADQLTFAGYQDWRLPATIFPDNTCSNNVGGGTPGLGFGTG